MISLQHNNYLQRPKRISLTHTNADGRAFLCAELTVGVGARSTSERDPEIDDCQPKKHRLRGCCCAPASWPSASRHATVTPHAPGFVVRPMLLKSAGAEDSEAELQSMIGKENQLIQEDLIKINSDKETLRKD